MSANGQANGKLALEKFSFGVGDRFGRQAEAQLRACMMAAEHGADIIPVWNKSNREHTIIGSGPSDARHAADAAIGNLGWKRAYHVDADHIRLETVDRFIPHSDFYTIDVADTIGKAADASAIDDFARRHAELAGSIEIPGIAEPFKTTRADIERIAGKYLLAVTEAGQIYRHIAATKGEGHFITEISMDETDSPQKPVELLVILAAIADARIPIQTIAPKFTGRFNKGVDYSGNVAQFEKEFNDDLAVIRFAIGRYQLPRNLKLSVHSGSDKFSIYGPMRRALDRFNAGLHVKTAGTTWLEEVIGLAEAGGDGLALAREIYAGALDHLKELCAPYATVIDIDPAKLPSREKVNGWTSEQFVAALRHDPKNSSYNPHLRQLLHVGYKIAAKMGDRYLDALKDNQKFVSKNVTDNLYERHLKPLFVRNGA
ncbi:MAG TPA: tagaturonate epimerase family protein [Candidatus Acidoferrales bacterium]|nr:tagaturonate epimerase family protein [Candidatus Acidoferrales bacterium]